MAHSSESLALDQVEDRYIMQKIQRITIGILNELSFWLKYGVLLLQGPGTKRQIGSAIRPKNSRLVAPPGFILRDTADSSGPDQWILHNLGSYESPESPLSLWV